MAEEKDEKDREGEERGMARRPETRSFSPFEEMNSIFEDLDRTLDQMLGRPSRIGFGRRTGDRTPAIDMRDLGDKYQIEAEIPGIDKDDLEIELRDGNLVIEGESSKEIEDEGEDYLRKERGYRSFYRQLPVPEEVEQEDVSASLDQGILCIDLPKKEEETKQGKKIEIK